MTQKVVIIGGVAGGASCAARLRRLNEEMEMLFRAIVVVLCRENAATPRTAFEYQCGLIV